jgi:hypothetical protein
LESGELPEHPAEDPLTAPEALLNAPPKAASNRGLANVFWGAGIYVPPRMTTAQRRLLAKVIAIVLATTVLPAVLACLCVGLVTDSWGWAFGAAAAVYLVTTIIGMFFAVRYDLRHGLDALAPSNR